MIRDSSKLLVVTGAALSSGLTDYALKVAIRLDLDIIILFVVEADSPVDVRHRRQLVQERTELVEKEVAAFTSFARKSEVRVSVVVDVGERKATVNRLRNQDPAIRFIMTDDCQTTNNQVRAHALPQLTVVEQHW